MNRGSEGARYRADAHEHSVEAMRLEEAGRSARLAGDYATARARFEAAIALLDGEHSARRARLHIQLSRMLWLSGDADASLHEAERATHLAPPGAPAAAALARLAVVLSHVGRTSEALAAARRAVEAAQSATDPEAEGIARMALGYALRSAGRLGAAAEQVEVAVSLAMRHGDAEAVVTRLIDLANSRHLAGDVAGAVDAAGRAVVEARRRGVSRGMAAASHSLYLFNAGRWQSAMRAVDDGLAEEPRFPWLVLMRAQILVGRGQLAPARRHLARVQRLAFGPRAAGWDGPQETAAELLLWAGDPAGALLRIREALEAIEVNERDDAIRDLAALGLRAIADLRGADASCLTDQWRAMADHLIDLCRRHAALMRDDVPETAGTHLSASAALCEAEYARVHGMAAPDAWRRAVELQDAVANPWRASYARLRLAQALRRSEDGPAMAEADVALSTAYRTAVRLGARLLQEAVEGEAGASLILSPRVALPAASAPREPRGLTPREREILNLLGAGTTNRKIARLLGISEKTVSVHVGSITSKLGVANRLEAVAVAIRLSAAPGSTG